MIDQESRREHVLMDDAAKDKRWLVEVGFGASIVEFEVEAETEELAREFAIDDARQDLEIEGVREA